MLAQRLRGLARRGIRDGNCGLVRETGSATETGLTQTASFFLSATFTINRQIARVDGGP